MRLKYYLRGLGIGIICTTLLMTIESHTNTQTMTDEEVIERAEELGMVMQEDADPVKKTAQDPSEQASTQKGENSYENNEGKQKDQKNDRQNKTSAAEGTAQPENGSAKKKSSTAQEGESAPPADSEVQNTEEPAKENPQDGDEPAPQLVEFEVEQGESSDAVARNLFQNHLVDDAEAFNDYVVSNGYDSRFMPGHFSIPEGSSYEEIVKILLEH